MQTSKLTGKNIIKMEKKRFCLIYGEGTINDCRHQKCFVKFCTVAFFLNNNT